MLLDKLVDGIARTCRSGDEEAVGIGNGVDAGLGRLAGDVVGGGDGVGADLGCSIISSNSCKKSRRGICRLVLTLPLPKYGVFNGGLPNLFSFSVVSFSNLFLSIALFCVCYLLLAIFGQKIS